VACTFHVMAKPRGAICNLGCRYCFYLDKAALYEASDFRMSDEVLEAYVRQYIESAAGGVADFAWQGGEPTLMGLEFFERVVEMQDDICPPGTQYRNALQTNGVLLDDDWCRFLTEHHFLVGLSLDGPRELHDANRVDKGGRPTFDRVMASLRRMQEHGTDFNTLTTVNNVTGKHPLEVYRFLRDEVKADFIQFIPVVAPVGSVASGGNGEAIATDSSVGPSEYGDFLMAIFDEWVRNDVGEVFVQIFDMALAVSMGLPASVCVFAETCGEGMLLEHTGDLYACDHFVEPEHLLGNIAQTPMTELARSPQQRGFGRDKRDELPQECLECPVRSLCGGGCPKNRLVPTGVDGRRLNYLCPSYKSFFTHIGHPVELMAGLVRRGRLARGVMELLDEEERARFARAGRNDPCPCGSGLKLKRCHG